MSGSSMALISWRPEASRVRKAFPTSTQCMRGVDSVCRCSAMFSRSWAGVQLFGQVLPCTVHSSQAIDHIDPM